MSAARKYDQEFRQRAVRLYRERLQQHDDSKLAARLQVGVLLDLNPATLRNWVEDAERSEGVRSPAPSRVVESERYGRCGGRMRSYAVLMRSCAPRARFRSGGARPPTQVIVAYIDSYRSRYGVETPDPDWGQAARVLWAAGKACCSSYLLPVWRQWWSWPRKRLYRLRRAAG
jgi:transposase-like protein